MASKNAPGKSSGKSSQGSGETPAASRRRAHEYDHEYGITLNGHAVEPAPKPPKPGSGKAGDKR